MDILIKNMDRNSLPRQLVIYPNGDVEELCEGNYEKVSEAIFISPYGVLKDYKVIKEEMEKILRRKMKEWSPFIASGFRYALEVLDKIPVVLEANNG